MLHQHSKPALSYIRTYHHLHSRIVIIIIIMIAHVAVHTDITIATATVLSPSVLGPHTRAESCYALNRCLVCGAIAKGKSVVIWYDKTHSLTPPTHSLI